MNFWIFAEIIAGLALGALATMVLFAIGSLLFEIFSGEEEAKMIVILPGILIWLFISYHIIGWILV